MYEFILYDETTGAIISQNGIPDELKEQYDKDYKNKIDGIYSYDKYYVDVNTKHIISRPSFNIKLNGNIITSNLSINIKPNEYIKLENIPINTVISITDNISYPNISIYTVNDNIFEWASIASGFFKLEISNFPYKNIKLGIVVKKEDN